MFSILTVQIALLTHSFIFTTLALLLAIVYRNTPGTIHFAIGSVLFQFGLMLFSTKVPSAYFWYIIVPANLLMLWGSMLQMLGISLFFNVSKRAPLNIGVATITSLVFVFFVFLYPNFSGRILTMSFALGYFYLCMLIHVIFNSSTLFKVSRFFLVPSLIIIIGILAVRSMQEILPGDFFATAAVNDFLLNSAFIIILLLLVGFFILSAETQVSQFKLLSQAHQKKAEAKSRIIQILNHEFKTPLNAVMLKLELMQEKYQQKQIMADIEFLQHINTQLTNITQFMLNNESESFLHKSKSDHQAITDIRAWLRTLVLGHREIAKSKGLSFTFNVRRCAPRRMMLNTQSLQLVLHNLLENAVKYTHTGTVQLNVQIAEQHNYLHFTVQDSGIGIPTSEIASILSPYKRASNARGYQGSGLGLATVKELVNGIGSELTIVSHENEGTQVNFYWPIIALTPTG